MRKVWIFVLLLALVGCKTTVPSQAITNNAVKDLQTVTQAVEHIKETTPKECKTDVLEADLRSILAQVNGVSGQIKNIELACKTEKNVLEQEKTTRDIIIVSLVALTAILGYFLLRKHLP